jgi:tryptophan synthase alpha chain
MLKDYIENKLKEKKILLMTHIVIGYPSFEESYKLVNAMVSAGVDIMELQIPFSEPIADGPVILNANQKSLANGSTVKKCLEFAGEVSLNFDIPFLFMSYYNILFNFGIENFASKIAQLGLKGAIVPDLPPEEGKEYVDAMKANSLNPIYLFSPTTPDNRLKKIAGSASGFIYCVARKGVTGLDTSFSENLDKYLARCRDATELPLALGFGVKNREDIDFLKGRVDIAVIGTQSIRVMENEGIEGVKQFISGLQC